MKVKVVVGIVIKIIIKFKQPFVCLVSNVGITFDTLNVYPKNHFMKNLFFVAFLLVSLVTYAQIDDDAPVKKHELKANAFNLIVFKTADFSYEYLINEESSFGASLLFNLQNADDDRDFEDGPYYNEKFAFTPFYRRYFSSKYAWGFFLEAFGMYNIQEDYNGYFEYDTNNTVYAEETSNNVAVGISVGGKFVSRGGFVFEFFGGAGRNIFQSNDDYATEIVPRLGASLGYRF